MESFKDLLAWQKGMELVKEVYRLTKLWPREEQFGLISQIRKSSTSILANIAEGFSRSSSADKAYKYTIARGECSETRTFLFVSLELAFTTPKEVEKADALASEVGKLLSGLIHTFSPNPNPNPNPS